MMQLFCKFLLRTRSFGTCSGYVGPYLGLLFRGSIQGVPYRLSMGAAVCR